MGVGEGVGVGLGRGVGLGVGIAIGVGVGTRIGVGVGVAVGSGVGTGTGVEVGEVVGMEVRSTAALVSGILVAAGGGDEETVCSGIGAAVWHPSSRVTAKSRESVTLNLILDSLLSKRTDISYRRWPPIVQSL